MSDMNNEEKSEKEAPIMKREAKGAAAGAAIVTAGWWPMLSVLGVPGLSASGISSGLATAGAIVGGGMMGGVAVVGVSVVAGAAIGYKLAGKNKKT